MAQSEFDKLYEHLESNKPDVRCQYLSSSNEDRYWMIQQCEERATQRIPDGRWMCDKHAELTPKFRVHEGSMILAWNLTGVKRLTVNGRFKKHG